MHNQQQLIVYVLIGVIALLVLESWCKPSYRASAGFQPLSRGGLMVYPGAPSRSQSSMSLSNPNLNALAPAVVQLIPDSNGNVDVSEIGLLQNPRNYQGMMGYTAGPGSIPLSCPTLTSNQQGCVLNFSEGNAAAQEFCTKATNCRGWSENQGVPNEFSFYANINPVSYPRSNVGLALN